MSGEIFGTGGGQRLADELGIPLLGTIPLDPRLREAGDAGVQFVTPEIAAIATRVAVRPPGSIAKPLTVLT
jgi:ATP-binding protein involved in chromosome partitioning